MGFLSAEKKRMTLKNRQLVFLVAILCFFIIARSYANSLPNKKVTISVRNAPVQDVIRMIAKYEGVNVIISNSVKGKVSFYVKDVTPKDAMNSLKIEYNLVTKRIDNNTILVMSSKQYLSSLTSNQGILMSERNTREFKKMLYLPRKTEVIHLKYANSEKLKKIVQSMFLHQSKSFGDKILVYKRLNDLVINANYPTLYKINDFIKKIDVPPKQIEIDAKIVEISSTYEKSLGIQWGGTFENYYTAPSTNKTFITMTGTEESGVESGSSTTTTTSTTGTTNAGGFPTNPFNPSLPVSDNFIVNLPATSRVAPTALNLGLLIGRADYNIDLRITAGELNGYTKIISSPKVLTNDGSEAKISNGQEIPYQETAGASGATSVSFKDATLSLSVLPRVAGNNNIIMNLSISKNSPDYSHSVQGEPPINKQSVKTTITVKNGQTIVIGGLVQKTKEKTESGVPILKSIPLIGWLFDRKDIYNPEYKLYIFITPRIVNTGD